MARARHRMMLPIIAPGGRHGGLLSRYSAARWLARQCLLAIEPRGGIAIDSACRASDHNVYAIGECASWERTDLRPGGPGLRHGPRGGTPYCGRRPGRLHWSRHEHSSSLMGVMCEYWRRPWQDAPQPQLPVRGRAPPCLQEDRHQRRRQTIAGRGADRRCGRNTARCCRWRSTASPCRRP